MKELVRFLSYSSLIVASAMLITMCCGGGSSGGDSEDERMTNMSSKSKQLMKKTWRLDAAAVREATAKAAHEAQKGVIKNIGDIKLGGDVAAMADFAQAKSLYFGFETGKNNLVYKITRGKGFLSSSHTGYWEWQENENKILLKGVKSGNKTVDRTYVIDELTDDQLVIYEFENGQKAKVPEIYIYGKAPSKAGGTPTKAGGDQPAAPTKAGGEQPAEPTGTAEEGAAPSS